jgi:hypothetical protein
VVVFIPDLLDYRGAKRDPELDLFKLELDERISDKDMFVYD